MNDDRNTSTRYVIDNDNTDDDAEHDYSSSNRNDYDTITTTSQSQLLPSSDRNAITPTTSSTTSTTSTTSTSTSSTVSTSSLMMKQLLCGGIAGSVAKTVTAPFSRLTILYQVHSIVSTKGQVNPIYATSIITGLQKIYTRGGLLALWKGNMTSVIHRFPYSAINFYVYENTLDILSSSSSSSSTISTTSTTSSNTTAATDATTTTTTTTTFTDTPTSNREVIRQQDEIHETSQQLVRRLTKIVLFDTTTTTTNSTDSNNNNNDDNINNQHHHTDDSLVARLTGRMNSHNSNNNIDTSSSTSTSLVSSIWKSLSSTIITNTNNPAIHKFIAGAVAGISAVTACYPLDLVRTRLSTELDTVNNNNNNTNNNTTMTTTNINKTKQHYNGSIINAFVKIYQTEGILGFYSGISATLLVAVPNFAISYTTYGTLKEYILDDDLFYNLRRIDVVSNTNNNTTTTSNSNSSSNNNETIQSQKNLGFVLTVLCGATSGILATLITFPMDTIRRRMQVQNIHVPIEYRTTSIYKQIQYMIQNEKGGILSLYRGLTPELIKVIPMVGTMFFVYERTKELLNVN